MLFTNDADYAGIMWFYIKLYKNKLEFVAKSKIVQFHFQLQNDKKIPKREKNKKDILNMKQIKEINKVKL